MVYSYVVVWMEIVGGDSDSWWRLWLKLVSVGSLQIMMDLRKESNEWRSLVTISSRKRST